MGYRLILASNSPRRKELLRQLDLEYEVRVQGDIDESYPQNLPVTEIAEYICQKKAAAYNVADDEILITADTIVIVPTGSVAETSTDDQNYEVLGKPKDLEDAKLMLRKLAGRTHKVITGCCIRTVDKLEHFSVTTLVSFKNLSDAEIEYYVSRYKPLDKAGAYGIQEWIGGVGVTAINGSYYNVMGLPIQKLYEKLVNGYLPTSKK